MQFGHPPSTERKLGERKLAAPRALAPETSEP
jgi:hypothetical protein